MSELTRTLSRVVLVPRGFIPSARGMSKSVFQYYLAHPVIEWACTFCALPPLSDSFFADISPVDVFSVTAGELGNDDLSSTSASFTELPTAWYRDQIKGYYKNNLSIGHLNVNSILGKIDEGLDLLNECRFDILFLSETKLDKFVSSTLLSKSHYRIIRRDRKRGAGGLLVYISNSLVARRKPKMEQENIESICLNVKGIANTSFHVCACYRSPNLCRVSDFISACSTAADKMLKSKSEMIFLGDFNIDMLQSNCNINLHSHTNPLTDVCDQFCVTNTIGEPTRVTKTSKSLIDVILVNRSEHWATSGSLQLDMNDHDLIYIVRKQRLSKSRVKVIESRF